MNQFQQTTHVRTVTYLLLSYAVLAARRLGLWAVTGSRWTKVHCHNNSQLGRPTQRDCNNSSVDFTSRARDRGMHMQGCNAVNKKAQL